MEKKLLILYICFLIVTLVPGYAMETSSIISQKTEDIKETQVSINEDKKEMNSAINSIKEHKKILQDTLDQMNDVKWYQFWKWYFLLYEGPEKIKHESSILEILSKNIKEPSNNIKENTNSTIKFCLDIAQENSNLTTNNNPYNTGNAKENANLIAKNLSTQFKKSYTVSEPETLKIGDIVQYPLTHNNYAYLQFIGMNPTGDKALFLGDHNTAIRLSTQQLNTIKYKISPIHQNTEKTTRTSPQTSYIANIQKEGLKNYKEPIIEDINNKIEEYNETKTTGSDLMITGGAIGGTSIILGIIALYLSGTCVTGEMGSGVLAVLAVVGICTVAVTVAAVQALIGVQITCKLLWAIIGILTLLSLTLAIASIALLGKGGEMYGDAKSKIDDLNENKTNFIKGCNDIETDLKTYHNGAVNILPLADDLIVDMEQNDVLYGKVNVTDADGDELYYNIFTNTTHGELLLSKDGIYIYTPKNGFIGNDTFTYTASDVYGNSNIATVTVIVHPFNHAPVSSDMTLDIETKTNLTGQLKATDQDKDPITYILLNSTLHGNITVHPDGSFTYIPVDGFIGNDTFTYAARDWKETGNIATVQINVHPINHAPVSSDINLKVAKNENLTFNLMATDEDGDNIFFKLIEHPSKGKITLNQNGTFTYTPNKNIVGKDIFTYKAFDWKEDSNIGLVNIEIFEFNHPPISHNISINPQKNHPYTGLFNTTDQDDDDLTYTIIQYPSHGTINILNNGKYTYKPNNGYIGNDNLIYTANDGKTQSNTATIKITITNIPQTIKQNLLPKTNQNTQNNYAKILQKNQKNIQNLPKTNLTPNNPQSNITNNTIENLQTQNNPINYIITFLNNTVNIIKQIMQEIAKLIPI